ncbi:MAG: DUF4303 domain-containing protein [Luteolibacter sp.]
MKHIESAWYEAAAAAIVSQATACPNEEYYAAAFWLCYVDYTLFGTPCFAMGTESHYAASVAESGESVRWSPPNWQYDVIDQATDAMIPHYQALSDSLAGRPDTVWDEAIEEHWRLLARVCRRLTHEARHREGYFSDLVLPSGFVVAIFEEREGEPNFSQLVHASVDSDILSTLPSPVWEP